MIHPIDTAAVVVELHQRLRDAGATIAVAESLTGGLVTAALTEPAGASDVVRGGLITYATDLKASLAGVGQLLLTERGAVDADVALELARGARERLGADVGVGVTGVAGPAEQDAQPVGTVFVAVVGPAGQCVARRDLGARHGDRPDGVGAEPDAIRRTVRCRAVEATLELVRRELSGVLGR